LYHSIVSDEFSLVELCEYPLSISRAVAPRSCSTSS
jgi:hypothetical protein